MLNCPVCDKEYIDVTRHVILKGAGDKLARKEQYHKHGWFVENLHTDDYSHASVKQELKKLGVEDGSYIRFGFIAEPESKNVNSSPSSAGVPHLIWEKANLSQILKGEMDWSEWLEFTSRHGEVFAKKPSKHKCIRSWAQGQMYWRELLIHLGVELNYRLHK
jgi:hypothetical protein